LLLHTEIVNDWEALAPLEPHWDALLHRSRADSIFLTWEWIQSWREAVGGSLTPFVVLARQESSELVGIAPLYRTRALLARFVPYRILRVLGDDQSGSEYPDWILREDVEGPAGLAIARTLAAARGWDCLWAPRVSGWMGARDRLIEACAGVGLFCRSRPGEFAATDLPADYATYLRSLSGNARSVLQRRTKQLFRSPDVCFERCESERDIPRFLDALFELNQRRWSHVGRVGTFVGRPLEAAFYRSFAGPALRRGWLWLAAIKVAGEFKAVQIGYVYNGTFHQLQEGFDPAGPNGVGNVLRARVIEECIRAGIKSYDFLGGFTEHKRRWLAQVRGGFDLFIGRRTLKNAPIFMAGIWPTGRYFRPVPPG